MRDKKGISGVITALIIVLLALVAAGVLWVVVQGTIQEAGGQIGGKAACLGINLNIVSAGACPSGSTSCDISVERKSGGEGLKGIRVVVTDDSSTLSGNGEALEVLDTTKVTCTGTALANDATTAKVSGVVDDGSGGNLTCDPSDTYSY
jgi:flagellin-like protein